MNNLILKKASCQDEDFKPADYSVGELEEMLKNNAKQAITPKVAKKQKNKELQKFKEQYFAYYDDVKSSSLKKQDW